MLLPFLTGTPNNTTLLNNLGYVPTHPSTTRSFSKDSKFTRRLRYDKDKELKKLFARGPPANKKLFAGGHPANKTLFARAFSIL